MSGLTTDRPGEPLLASRSSASIGPACGRAASRGRALALVLSVVALTGLALWLRLEGLGGWDGTLTVDESRLALAARGVVETGLPRLPSGWLYTRGLLATYLTAPAFMLLGESDFAARLPAVLAGTALIPVAFLLGRSVGGWGGGLFLAALLAGHPSFVVWSRQAWFYALYVLLFATALWLLLRADRTARIRDQLLAGAAVGLTGFAHEVGLFLLAPLAALAGFQILAARQSGLEAVRRSGWIGPVLSLAMAGALAVILWLLITRLRADSLVGAYGEIDEYLSPSVEWSRMWFYVRVLLDGPGLMLALALLAVPLAVRARLTSTLILWLALLPTLVHAAFLIPRGPQERYGLTLVLVVGVLAVQGAALLSVPLSRLLRRSSWPTAARATPPLVAGLLLAVTLVGHQDVERARARAALSPNEGAWLRLVRERGIGPEDVVMTDIPTTVAWYVGGLDYWLVSQDYEKYTTRSDDVHRDIHTGAVLVRSRGELERLARGPLAGRTVWVIASGRNYQWSELVDDDLKTALGRLTAERLNPGDNARILLLQLPHGT